MHDIAHDAQLLHEGQQLFQIRALSYRYPNGHCALKDIDLDIYPGDRIALVGQNGSGKTTLVKHLNGIYANHSGSLLYKGQVLSHFNLIQARRQVGILFQDPDDHLFNNTIYEDVAFGPMNQGLTRDEVDKRVRDALHKVGLERLMYKAPHQISYGQKKRAALAAILAMEPEVLILDEPTANLDPKQENIFAQLLKEFAGTLICISHDLLFLYGLCTRAVVLDYGRIHHDYSLKELVSHRASLHEHGLDFTFRFKCCQNGNHIHPNDPSPPTQQTVGNTPAGSPEEVPAEKPPAIRLRDYSFHYQDGTWGFRNITLHISEGEKIAIVGENGAGKSTLAACLMGIRQGFGEYYFKDSLIRDKNRGQLWRQVGMVFQDSADQLFCPSCWEEVAFGPKQMELTKEEIEMRVSEALSLVKLSGFENRVPLNLSGGERKRLAIAAVLSMRPEILILDEPTASLDPRNEELLLHLLQNLPVTQILISHDMFFIANSTQRTIVMHQGQLIRDSSTNVFFEDDHLQSINRLDYTYKNICGQEIMKMQEARGG